MSKSEQHYTSWFVYITMDQHLGSGLLDMARVQECLLAWRENLPSLFRLPTPILWPNSQQSALIVELTGPWEVKDHRAKQSLAVA